MFQYPKIETLFDRHGNRVIWKLKHSDFNRRQ